MGKDLVTVTLSREDSNESWGFRLAGGKGTGQPLTISQSVVKESLAAKVGLTANDFLVSVAGEETANMTHQEAEQAIHGAGNRFQMVIQRDEELHNIMDLNKVFPKPKEVEERLKKNREEEERRREEEEVARVRALAPPAPPPPTIAQIIQAQIGGHSLDRPISNPSLTDKMINEELETMFDLDLSDKRKCVNFKKYEKKPSDLSASKTLEMVRDESGESIKRNKIDSSRIKHYPADLTKSYNRKDWNCPWVHKDGRGLKQAMR
ncbi:PDZ and LIM domain protein 7 [Eurytemora carolleeae]|uniref:PDZ and LIM domain protein 7 n=1 Tax=Eurytemora carolleeae TaxID=1294199 RepID=UPI000C779E67|nr:PDZ and LIM domain protein 7 [Eurytemora carolleeae]|eukprot:XP_023333888.1 PDZ and LIM domain protein 7-like [Eurytemora affinis]